MKKAVVVVLVIGLSIMNLKAQNGIISVPFKPYVPRKTIPPSMVRDLQPTSSAATTNRDSNVTLIGRWAAGPCYAVAAEGNLVCFGNGAYLEIADISDPSNPAILGQVTLPSPIKGIAISGI